MASKAHSKVRELGIIYADEQRGDIEAILAEEEALKAERELAQEKSRKDLIKVDHSTIDYMPFKKNLFILPRALAKLSDGEVAELRSTMNINLFKPAKMVQITIMMELLTELPGKLVY